MPDLRAVFHHVTASTEEAETFSILLNSPLANSPVRRHPLGFHYVKVTNDTGFALRLHIWPRIPASGQIGFEIHDHVFDMTSVILKGAVRQQTFMMEDDAAGNHRLYDASYENARSVLTATERRVRLVENTDEVFCAGSMYCLPAGVLHTLMSIQEPTVTCVLTRTKLESARSLGPATGPLVLVAERSAICAQQRLLTLEQATDLDTFVDLVGSEA